MKGYTLKSTGDTLHIDPESSIRGGEGTVYRLKNKPDAVVKIYHKDYEEHSNKLNVMITQPPHDPMIVKGHHSIAWPKDFVMNKSGQCIGFLMPYVKGDSVFSYLLPEIRYQKHPHSRYLTLIRISRNIASAVDEIHKAGHAIGDLNMSNIVVRKNALVTLIDCDSFEINETSSKKIFPCRVGMPEYIAPEFQGKAYASFNGGSEQDYFAMAVVLFQLLMEGMHPFSGSYKYGNGVVNIAENIRKGLWPYDPKRESEFTIRPVSPAFGMLDPILQNLFIRCFRDGAKKSKAPSYCNRVERGIGEFRIKFKLFVIVIQAIYMENILLNVLGVIEKG